MNLKFFNAKRICRVYYHVKYSIEKQQPYREYFTKKLACICFLGIPVKVISSIYVPSHQNDLNYEL